MRQAAIDGELVGGGGSGFVREKAATPANSLIAVIRVTRAVYLASYWAPVARMTNKTVGMAMGIPPVRRMRMLSRGCSTLALFCSTSWTVRGTNGIASLLLGWQDLWYKGARASVAAVVVVVVVVRGKTSVASDHVVKRRFGRGARSKATLELEGRLAVRGDYWSIRRGCTHSRALECAPPQRKQRTVEDPVNGQM